MKTDTPSERTESSPPPVEFKVGTTVSGRSFFGRAEEVHELSAIFRTDCCYSVVGPTRIGKTSLVQRVFHDFENADHIIPLRLTMSEYDTPVAFWKELWERVLETAADKGVSFCGFSKDVAKLTAITEDTPAWYDRMRTPLKKCMEGIRKVGWRVVLALDEFDAVIDVFGNKTAYYQLLRTLFSEETYCLNGVVISRSNLPVLEAKEGSISNFHGIFKALRLKGFNEKDMEEFYAALRTHAVEVTPDGRKLLRYYTGNIPYLCCMFAQRLIRYGNGAVGEEEIQQARQELRPDIRQYYDTLVSRLKTDDHLDALVYLAFDDIRTAQYRKYQSDMIEMGYLNKAEENGESRYYAYSMDFMEYIRRMPLRLPTWDLLSGSEKRLKCLFGKKYPELKTIRYSQFNKEDTKSLTQIISKKYDLKLDFPTIKKHASVLSGYKPNPSILDVLALKFVIDNICSHWPVFEQHFKRDADWKERLSLIARLRNPIAHSKEEYISEQELSSLNEYCKQIIDMLPLDDESIL